MMPILEGKEAREFLARMKQEEEHPNPARVAMIKKAMSMKFKVKK